MQWCVEVFFLLISVIWDFNTTLERVLFYNQWWGVLSAYVYMCLQVFFVWLFFKKKYSGVNLIHGLTHRETVHCSKWIQI